MTSRFVKASLIGALAVGILMIPFLGMVVGIPLAFVCMATGDLLKAYCESGKHVEIGFAWVTVHSTHAYFVYWAIFTTLIFLVILPFGWRGSKHEKGLER